MLRLLIPELQITARDLFLLLLILDGLFILYMLYRNGRVFRYRASILKIIAERNSTEIEAGIYDQWERRNERFNKVRYEAMVWCFWRPIDSFYEMTLLMEGDNSKCH